MKYTKRIFENTIKEYEEAKEAFENRNRKSNEDSLTLYVKYLNASAKYDEMMIDLLLEDDSKYEVVI